VLIAVAAVAFLVFLGIEARSDHALLDLSLFRHAGFNGVMAAALIVNFAAFAPLTYTSIWLQGVERVSAIGVGTGLAVPSFTAAVMGSVPPDRGGMASGTVSTARQLGFAVGIAVLGSVRGRGQGTATRITRLIREIQRDPFTGIGKPEPLKGDLSGYWSRRIDDEHRLVYRADDKKEVKILKARYHYGSD
jgi:toxin YoeB